MAATARATPASSTRADPAPNHAPPASDPRLHTASTTPAAADACWPLTKATTATSHMLNAIVIATPIAKYIGSPVPRRDRRGGGPPPRPRGPRGRGHAAGGAAAGAGHP